MGPRPAAAGRRRDRRSDVVRPAAGEGEVDVQPQRPASIGLAGKTAAAFLAIFSTVLVGAGLFFVQGQVSGTKKETARLISIADQLQTDTDWGDHGGYVGYRGIFCRPDSGCAELARRWRPVPGLTGADLQARIDAAGWDLMLDGDCIRKPNDSGLKTLCRGEGAVQGYEVWVRVISESSYRPEPMLSLSIF